MIVVRKKNQDPLRRNKPYQKACIYIIRIILRYKSPVSGALNLSGSKRMLCQGFGGIRIDFGHQGK